MTTTEILNRVLRVCRESGYRRLGILKRIDENRNFMRCLTEVPDVLKRFPWFGGCIEAHDMFFVNLLNALRTMFPDVGTRPEDHPISKHYPQSWKWRDYSRHLIKFENTKTDDVCACMERVLQVCNPIGDTGLLGRIDENREFLQTMYDNPDICDKILFVRSWIDDHDLFFEDLRRALDSKLPVNSTAMYPREWPGRNHARHLIRF